jgi:hypothetical protein
MDPVSETSRSLECRTVDKIKKKVMLRIMHHRQNPLESTRENT